MYRFLIADDHSVVRRGLRDIIQEAFPQAVIEEATDSESLVSRVMQSEFDLVITDLAMPGRNGLEAIAHIHQHFSSLPILALSIYPEEIYAVRVLRNGASGYLNKDSAPEELVTAIRTIAGGKKYITPQVALLLAERISVEREDLSLLHLSDRELEVLRLLVQGLSISQMARRMHLNITTISTYRKRLLTKLSLSSNADLIRFAIKNNLQ